MLLKLDFRSVFRLLAAVLILGELRFVSDGAEGSRSLDPNCRPSDPGTIAWLSQLLGVPADSLVSALTSLRFAGGQRASIYRRPLNPVQAEASRDAAAKHTYSALFSFLFQQTNAYLGSDSERFIGLLDLFGFEKYEAPRRNGFEQVFLAL